MKKPNFLCVGAAKSATSSLHYYLSQHPEIFLPNEKELHYFSHKEYTENINGPGDEICTKISVPDLESYMTYFSEADDFEAVGEMSPSYFAYPDVPERIYKELGQIKIIVMLRNPLGRAYSNYWHMVRCFGEKLSFYDALQAEDSRLESGWNAFWGYRKLSHYADMLQRYIDVFGRENVHIVLYEDFSRDVDSELAKIFLFLGVDADVSLETNTQINTTTVVRNPFVKIVQRLMAPFPRLAKFFLGKKLARNIRKTVMSLAGNLSSGRGMKINEVEFLLNHLSNDIANVERILGVKTGWLDVYLKK